MVLKNLTRVMLLICCIVPFSVSAQSTLQQPSRLYLHSVDLRNSDLRLDLPSEENIGHYLLDATGDGKVVWSRGLDDAYVKDGNMVIVFANGTDSLVLPVSELVSGAGGGDGIYGGSGSLPNSVVVDQAGFFIDFQGGYFRAGDVDRLESNADGIVIKSVQKIEFDAPRITFGGNSAQWVPAATQTDAFNSFLLGFNNSTGDWFRAPGPTWFSLVNIGNTVGTAVTDLALTAGTDVLVVPGTTTLSDQGNAFSLVSPGVVARSGTAANGQPLEIEASVSFVPASTAVYELTIGIEGVYASTYPEGGGNGFAESVTCVAGETCTLTAKAHSYGLEPGVTISVGMNTTVSNTVNIRRYSLSGKIIK